MKEEEASVLKPFIGKLLDNSEYLSFSKNEVLANDLNNKCCSSCLTGFRASLLAYCDGAKSTRRKCFL